MLDFNSAPEQRDYSNPLVIPPDSIVKVRLEIQQPEDKKISLKSPALSVSEKGNHYLTFFAEVAHGSFEGKKIYCMYTVDMDVQNDKTQKAINNSKATIRAMLEASRNINPKDPSTQAAQARIISSWFDLDGLEFPAKIGIKPIKAGDQYINNEIIKIITPDMPEYSIVMGGGEIITEKPIPKLPEPGKQSQPAGAFQPPQGSGYQPPKQTHQDNGPGQYTPPPTGQQQPQPPGNTPWFNRPKA